MSEVLIKVCGYTSTGKSTIIDIIKGALEQHGLDNININSDDDVPDKVKNFRTKDASSNLKDLSIEIEEVRLRRPALVTKKSIFK